MIAGVLAKVAKRLRDHELSLAKISTVLKSSTVISQLKRHLSLRAHATKSASWSMLATRPDRIIAHHFGAPRLSWNLFLCALKTVFTRRFNVTREERVGVWLVLEMKFPAPESAHDHSSALSQNHSVIISLNKMDHAHRWRLKLISPLICSAIRLVTLRRYNAWHQQTATVSTKLQECVFYLLYYENFSDFWKLFQPCYQPEEFSRFEKKVNKGFSN